MIKEKELKNPMLFFFTLLTAIVLIDGCQLLANKNDALNQLEQHRKTYIKAVSFNKKALAKLDDPNTAESWFRKAIAADQFYGPAHNNLAILLRDKGSIYEAAKRFELAVKCMPSNTEPLFNLGQLSEDSGHVTNAIDYYQKALEINPDGIRLAQALCRAKVKANQKDVELSELLERIAEEGQNDRWCSWAKEQLSIISNTDTR